MSELLVVSSTRSALVSAEVPYRCKPWCRCVYSVTQHTVASLGLPLHTPASVPAVWSMSASDHHHLLPFTIPRNFSVFLTHTHKLTPDLGPWPSPRSPYRPPAHLSWPKNSISFTHTHAQTHMYTHMRAQTRTHAHTVFPHLGRLF